MIEKMQLFYETGLRHLTTREMAARRELVFVDK